MSFSEPALPVVNVSGPKKCQIYSHSTDNVALEDP